MCAPFLRLRVVVGEQKIIILPRDEKIKKNRVKWLTIIGHKIHAIYAHEEFNPYSEKFEHDIALLQLSEPVKWRPKIRPVCLPTVNQGSLDDAFGYVSGWGRDGTDVTDGKDGTDASYPKKLNYVSLKIQPKKTCYKDENWDKIMFCAGEADGKKDACAGDSGGAFVVNSADNQQATKFSFKVVGIVSYGPRCGTKGEYGHYTRVGNYLNWINKTIEAMKTV